MISLETIEELETKIMKALELISDLRAENNRLESDNEALRSENDQMKLAMEEKEREIASLREQLAQSLKELEEYKSKEKKLDNKIHDMMNRLDNLSSYIDAAVHLIAEFKETTFAVLKHTNACGVATKPTVVEAWKAALAADPVSAFGGVLITNATIDEATATEIDKLFFEVLIAPAFDAEALQILMKKKNRILLKQKLFDFPAKQFKSLLNGVIAQDFDILPLTPKGEQNGKSPLGDLGAKTVTKLAPTDAQVQDLLFANKLAKHLKSNTIVLAKDQQLLAMGCGQTSRVDALQQAINKAKAFGFDLQGCVMASDAFFPFPDCVEIADNAGVSAVIHPGGSIKDQDSIDYCDAHNMAMVLTGIRHFKH
jgi:phosphoribosylaminoimidazolecarboxamide formyltransferase/IMP cyclohydrolase